jgi:hypothetical protein
LRGNILTPARVDSLSFDFQSKKIKNDETVEQIVLYAGGNFLGLSLITTNKKTNCHACH